MKQSMFLYSLECRGSHKVPFGCKTVSEELSCIPEQLNITTTLLDELVELVELN